MLEHAEDTTDSVLKFVNEFCWKNHWMMHVGDEKGAILDGILKKHKPKYILELGTYCAYSTIRMSQFIPEDGKIVTIDPFPTKASVQLVGKAKCASKVVFVKGMGEEVLPTLAERFPFKFDLVFIDHDKKAYLSDLKLIEKYELIHPGSVVVADNIVVFKINNYCSYVKSSPTFSSTETLLAKLEFTEDKDMVDGLEVSIWCGKK